MYGFGYTPPTMQEQYEHIKSVGDLATAALPWIIGAATLWLLFGGGKRPRIL